MKTITALTALFLTAPCILGPSRALGDGPFVRLTPLPAPTILAWAEEFPGGAFRAIHLVDGLPGTEFASNGKGSGTFVEFDFGSSIALGAFRHVDRNDPANVAESRLTFLDQAGAGGENIHG